jgi:hypothetical protein
LDIAPDQVGKVCCHSILFSFQADMFV